MTTTHPMNLRDWDVIVLNTSAGKDSQAMMDAVHRLAVAQGVEDRLVAVHADLGRVEWKGTRELAERQAVHYGIPFRVVSRSQDLLDQVRGRGMWPSSTTRYCTSDHKRDQISKVITALVREWRQEAGQERRCRVLNCLGLRAQESPARAKLDVLVPNKRASTKTTREVANWHPILDWSEEEVWATIRASGVPHHEAYDHGMPRLSCVFCVFASRSALVIAGEHNPELLDRYVEVEQEIGHTFRQDLPIEEIRDALNRGERAEVGAGWNA